MPLHPGQQYETVRAVDVNKYLAGTHMLEDSADEFDVIVIGSGMGGMTTAAIDPRILQHLK